MEHRTNENINTSIKNWTIKLLQNPNMTYDNVCELESHLLDEMEALQEVGLSVEEAFLIATKRIGHIHELTTEYHKVNKSIYFRNKVTPYIKGILLFISFVISTEILTNLLMMAKDIFGFGKINFSLTSITMLTILSLSLCIVYYYQYEKTQLFFQRITRIPVLILTVILSFVLRIGLSIMNSSFNGSSNSKIFEVYLAHNENRLLIGLIVLTISFLIYYFAKKENRLELAK